MLASYASAGRPGTLALNVKADGLQPMVKDLLQEFDIRRYFMFDMSIPDTLQWLASGLNVFVRQSEYEPSPALYDQAAEFGSTDSKAIGSPQTCLPGIWPQASK